MERREFIALLGGAAVATPSTAYAQPPKSARQNAGLLVGTWGYVSSVNIREDGSGFDRWGADAKGVLMIDGHGRYSQIIVGSESRVFGAKTYFSFGTYSFDESQKIFITRVEASSIPRLVGIAQRRVIVALTADKLRYVNHHTAAGTKTDAAWKRLG